MTLSVLDNRNSNSAIPNAFEFIQVSILLIERYF
jgi:hypothetical protein